jgi:hypothetical protein
MTNPTGLPALKHANALFFLFDGTLYAAPRIPTAGGTAAADHNPRRPQKMSRYIALEANPAIRLDIAKAAMAKIRRERRPKVSATLAKKRRKAPELSLDIISPCVSISRQKQGTHAPAALIHVICALVIFKSRPMGAVITVVVP